MGSPGLPLVRKEKKGLESPPGGTVQLGNTFSILDSTIPLDGQLVPNRLVSETIVLPVQKSVVPDNVGAASLSAAVSTVFLV